MSHFGNRTLTVTFKPKAYGHTSHYMLLYGCSEPGSPEPSGIVKKWIHQVMIKIHTYIPTHENQDQIYYMLSLMMHLY
ncbi:Hypothetical protein CINCED_3A005266 [Cinara cedri]|uniref:Uncharacterized protein n=1 Tax=Cinara cedri TaxID=506608 RepID=A0A5E4N039_9HEMI|nr:Hypothetical protein CINCED_3A005266 [Cinara cedri]